MKKMPRFKISAEATAVFNEAPICKILDKLAAESVGLSVQTYMNQFGSADIDKDDGLPILIPQPEKMVKAQAAIPEAMPDLSQQVVVKGQPETANAMAQSLRVIPDARPNLNQDVPVNGHPEIANPPGYNAETDNEFRAKLSANIDRLMKMWSGSNEVG